MADYYLKTDNIMKNMFTVALKDELTAQSQRGMIHPETESMLQKVREKASHHHRGTEGTSQCPQPAAGQVSGHGQVQ